MRDRFGAHAGRAHQPRDSCGAQWLETATNIEAYGRTPSEFSDRFPTNDEIEAIDAKRDRDLNARPRG
jgi:hypothetical protein